MKNKKKLIKLLQRAHAIEIGAYEAYEGHMASIKPISNPVRGKIKWIQVDELLHREFLYKVLQTLGARPYPIWDAILYIIGRSIAIACHIIPAKMANWGAKIMEILGSGIYYKLADEAFESDMPYLALELIEMAKKEEEHEKFFHNPINTVTK